MRSQERLIENFIGADAAVHVSRLITSPKYVSRSQLLDVGRD